MSTYPVGDRLNHKESSSRSKVQSEKRCCQKPVHFIRLNLILLGTCLTCRCWNDWLNRLSYLFSGVNDGKSTIGSRVGKEKNELKRWLLVETHWWTVAHGLCCPHIFHLWRLEGPGDPGKTVTKTKALSRVHAKLLQLCLTLCDPMDHSLPGSSVHWILQARILEWVAVPSSKGSSWRRDQTLSVLSFGSFCYTS